MIEYVVGFAIDRLDQVALIRKNRPDWQRGLLNGIGGKVEPGEVPENAMVREFHEETGLKLTSWEHFLTMSFPDATIYFYRHVDTDPRLLSEIRSVTDEKVGLFHVYSPGLNVVPNLLWLIPLAAHNAEVYEPIHVQARWNGLNG